MKVLIVVDMQNDFVTGPLGTPEAVAIVPKVKEKVEEYLSRGDRVIFTQDTHAGNYLNTREGKHLPIIHCIFEDKGWNIVDELSDLDREYTILKHDFGYGWWRDYLENGETIEVVGVCTDICVITNVLNIRTALWDSEITVDASCCAGTTPENHKAALQVMKSCQINVINE